MKNDVFFLQLSVNSLKTKIDRKKLSIAEMIFMVRPTYSLHWIIVVRQLLVRVINGQKMMFLAVFSQYFENYS